MNKLLLKIIIIIVVIAVGGGAYYLLSGKNEPSEIKVEKVKVQYGSISEVVTATGTLEPITQVDVGTQVSGVVEKIYVDYNSTVKAGQLIAELDKTTLKATVEEATSNVEAARNELTYRQTAFDRAEALFNGNNGPKADYETALYQLNSAKFTLKQRENELLRAKTNLGYANIYSPINGVVLSKDVNVGQTVAASFSTPTLFTIAQDLSKMQVEADVDEADIGNVTAGQRVTFTVDAFPDVSFSGVVTQVRLNPTTTSNVVTYTVVIKADNPELKLLPGLTAVVSIYTFELKDILTLKTAALNFEPDPELLQQYQLQQGATPPQPGSEGPMSLNVNQKPPEEPTQNGTMVWMEDNGRIHPVQVKTGNSDGIIVEILEGLEQGDEVIINMSQMSVSTASNDNGGRSPFMPTPPGQRKKKS